MLESRQIKLLARTTQKHLVKCGKNKAIEQFINNQRPQ